MYKNELDNHIRNKTISNSFLFYGESHFLIDMYTKILTNIEDASIVTFYYDEYNFSSAKAHLSQASLFGGNNILVIKNDKKIPKKELETLFLLCEKNKDNLFIFAYYGSDNKAYANAFSKLSTMVVRFFHPKPYEAQNILLSRANELHINISKYTISHLLQLQNGDIALAMQELEKLSIFQHEITNKDIEQLVYGLSEVSLEEFLQKLIEKKEFLDDLHNLLEHGEDPIRILGAFTNYITQLYMFNIYIRINGAPNAKEILGYNAPKFVVEKKAATSMKIKLPTYTKLTTLLLESELKMKSSNADKEAILFATLLEIGKII